MCSTLMQSMAASGLPASSSARQVQSGIGEVDALRRAQIGEPFVPPPGGDAVEMRSNRCRSATRSGAARGARKSVTCWPVPLPSSSTSPVCAVQKTGNRGPDRLVIAVKGRAIQPAIGRGRVAVFAVFDDEFSHGCNQTHCRAQLGMPGCCGQRRARQAPSHWRITGPPSLFLRV